MQPYESAGLVAWLGPIFDGAIATLEIGLLSYAIGLVLGMLCAGARLSHSRVLQVIARTYTGPIRAVPELVLIILLYYAGSQLLNIMLHQWLGMQGSVEFSGFVTAVGVLAVVQGAYMAEVFRGAIVAIPAGQIEAADAFGFSRWKRFWRIIMPGMLPNAIPGMSNLWLILVKDTALVSIVGYQELFFTTQQAAASTRSFFLFYSVTGAIYLVMTLGSNALFQRLERHVRRGQPQV